MAVLNPYNYKKPAVPVNMMKKLDLKQVKPKAQPKSQQDSYLEQKIMAAKPEELTLMLYEGLVKFIKMGCLYIEQKNFQKSNEMSLRAQAIITELQATLNMDYDISNELDLLYNFVLERLVEGNITKDVKIFREAQEIAEELQATWKQAINLL